jgi:methylmalonyl-CoA mutase C-terminal domain/subunit
LVILGGTVLPEEVSILKAAGIARVFGPGSSLESIIIFIHSNVSRDF